MTNLTKDQEKAMYEWLPAVGSALQLKRNQRMVYFKSLEAMADYLVGYCSRDDKCVMSSFVNENSWPTPMFFVTNVTLGNGTSQPAIIEFVFEMPSLGKPYQPFYFPMFVSPIRGRKQGWKDSLEILVP